MKKGLRKVSALVLTAGLCVGLVSGCSSQGTGPAKEEAGGQSGGQVTVKFVHKFPEEGRMKYFQEVINEFEKENPNIKIEMTAYGDEEIKDKTRVLLGSDDAPDIFFTWSGERITQYVDSGNALNLTKYMDEDQDWKNHFNQAMLDCCYKNGSCWAIPWDYSSKEIVYNKKVFSELGLEIPKTWEELKTVCQVIKDSGTCTPIAVGNQYPWVICHYITTLNGKLVPKETLDQNYTMEAVEYMDPGYAQALDMVRELYESGYTNQDINSCTWEMSQAMVQEGKAAMIYEEVQNLINYENALGDDWGYFDFPEIEGAKGESGYITGGPDVFMVNSSSKHPDEAITFLKYITSDAVQAKMVYELGFLPVTSVELDAAKTMPEIPEIIEKNLSAPGISEWLDCAINQTVADTYLIGCQTIFDGRSGASIMEEISATAKEVEADQ